MAQHFLLSPAAKTLSLVKVMRMSDAEARSAFRKVRWSDTDGKPVCPVCGCCDSYDLAARQVYKCKGCGKQFSITSGTISLLRQRWIEVQLHHCVSLSSSGCSGFRPRPETRPGNRPGNEAGAAEHLRRASRPLSEAKHHPRFHSRTLVRPSLGQSTRKGSAYASVPPSGIRKESERPRVIADPVRHFGRLSRGGWSPASQDRSRNPCPMQMPLPSPPASPPR